MLEDLQIRRYSPTTIRIYQRCIAEFAQHFGKPPDRLGAEHIRQYQLFLIKEKKVSRSTFIQMVCALRFFYAKTRGKTRRDCSSYRFCLLRQSVLYHGSYLPRRRRQIGPITLTCVAHPFGTEDKNESDD